MAVLDAFAEVKHEFSHDLVTHAERTDGCRRSSGKRLAAASVSHRQGVHVLLEVKVEKFKDEIQLVTICVDNVEQVDDIRVVHLPEDRDLADGCAGDALVLGLEADLLEGHEAAIVRQVPGFVDDAVSSCGSASQ